MRSTPPPMEPMDKLERLIAEHPFFAGLEPGYVDLLAGCATNVVFSQGAFVFHEGDPANHFYLLRHGTVALEIAGPALGPIVIQTLAPGGILGYSWLFPPYRVRFDARVVEDVRALAFDAACLRAKCEDDPKLGYELMKRFSSGLLERLQATRIQLLDIYGVGHAG